MMRKVCLLCLLLTWTMNCIAQELPLPAVPAELRQPKERAAYILEHFWDEMDFSDRRLGLDVTFMEQNMVNYLSLFPHADTAALPSCIGKLLESASVDAEVLELVYELAGQYLYEPHSPMWNEEYSIIFLKEYLKLPSLTGADRIRPEYHLEEMLKNRVGATAADFSFTDRKGRQRTLHKMPKKPMLLVFYSPDCAHCTEVMDGIKKLKGVRVLAVCAESEYAIWNRTKHTLPAGWTVGITSETEKYNIPVFPTIYYLSGRKVIERKAFEVKEKSLWTTP